MKREETQQFNAGPYVSYIWSIADDWLRDVYVPSDYRKVILPMVVLRRLDLVLEPTKAKVLEMKRALDGDKNCEFSPGNREEIMRLFMDMTDDPKGCSRVFDNEEFGYWQITVERPLVENCKVKKDKKGRVQPDKKLRDTENVPFTYPGGIDGFFEKEVKPYVPDAWVDKEATKVGYEISFTKYFYKPVRLRELADIAADLKAVEAEAKGLLAEVTGKREEVFAAIWHDWIVAKEGQLAAFTRYIRENPTRHWRRKMNRQYFQRVQSIEFVGRTWYGYGNLELLKLPMLVPIKGHRATAEGSEEWNALVARASRIGPGGAGVSTFMSPLEKACGHALGLAGGKWVVLSPEGFGERWHPGREYEKFCAEGRMLFLSLWPAMTRQPTKKELYERCHEMGDVVAAGLGRSTTHKGEACGK